MFRTRPTTSSATRWTGLAGIVALSLVIVACDSSSSPSPSASEAAASEPAASEAPASEAPASEAPQSGQITVTIIGSSFGPDITITAGSSVVFVNNDGFGHTATNGENGTAEADPLFDESLADGASSEPIVFDTPGVYNVTCTIHSSMNMTITVV